jgi:hypothetical protein
MADALTTITNLINSPPGQLVAGGAHARGGSDQKPKETGEGFSAKLVMK